MNREYLGAAHAGAEQPRRERDQGRLRRARSSGTRTSRPGRITGRRPTASTTGSPRITFTGFTIGGNAFYPRHGAQDSWSVRDDFTFSYDARGRHDLQGRRRTTCAIIDDGNNCQACMGKIDARSGRRSPAEHRGAVPGRVQRRHLEPRGDFAPRADLRHRRRRLRHPRRAAAVRRLAAGRLADRVER